MSSRESLSRLREKLARIKRKIKFKENRKLKHRRRHSSSSHSLESQSDWGSDSEISCRSFDSDSECEDVEGFPDTPEIQEVRPTAEGVGLEAGEKLPEEVLAVLGASQDRKEEFGPAIHHELAARWSTIVTSGLMDDECQKLLDSPVPENLKALVPPKVNDDVKDAVNEADLVRDRYQIAKQQMLSTAVSKIGQVLSEMLKDPNCENLKTIEELSVAGRLLCNLHFEISKTRRSILVVKLNKEAQLALSATTLGDQLFGDSIEEKLKEVREKEKRKIALKRPENSKRPVQRKTRTRVGRSDFFPRAERQQPQHRLKNQPRRRQDYLPRNQVAPPLPRHREWKPRLKKNAQRPRKLDN
ncbi:Hypothetical protein NTJ_15744 [Nesidiocoris tenuis]|uniref:Uncharacterized protein n=1 Tax=Nesidiocoris tenuis TaxID=355587 RepID=A0ABN7BEX3_9HEMI|nr:Hypothetical protein NTJ_15744 [Nesidiocoris tenuis]